MYRFVGTLVIVCGFFCIVSTSVLADDVGAAYPSNSDCTMSNLDENECASCDYYYSCDDGMPDGYELVCTSDNTEIWCSEDYEAPDDDDDGGCGVVTVRGTDGLHAKLLVVFVMGLFGLLALIRSRKSNPSQE